MPSRPRRFLAILLLASVVVSSGCFDSKTIVTKVKPVEIGNSNGKMNGVFYALPRTVVTVSVPLVRKVYTRGKFHEYARIFFPDDKPNFPTGAAANEVREFTVKPAVFDTRGEPDPDEIYMVSVQGGRFETKSLLVDLTDEGVLSHTKAESKDDTLEFVTGAIKTGAGIVGELIPVLGAASAATTLPTSAKGIAESKSALPRNSPPLTPDETVFHSSLTTAAEQAFFTTLGHEERDFYRFEMTTDAERSFYRSLTPAEASFFRELPRRERNSYINLTEKDERTFYSSLTTSEEKEFFANLLPTHRRLYMTLNASQAMLFMTLTPDQANFLVGNPGYKFEFFEAKKVYDKIQGFIKQRDDLLSLAARSALPPDTLKRLLEELDATISSMKNTYFLGVEITTENSIGTFQYRPPTNMRLAVGSPYSPSAITDYLLQAGFTNAPGGAPGTFTVGAGAVAIYTRLSPPSSVTVTADGAGNIASISGGVQSFDLKPETIGDFTMNLFIHSKDHGVCEVSADQGIKAPPKFDYKAGCGGLAVVSVFRLKLSPGRDGHGGPQPYDRIRSASLDERGERGFSYRYPALYLARVESIQPTAVGGFSISDHGRAPVTIAQLGLTVSLPATTKGRRTSYELALYEKSGALKNFNMGSDAAIQKAILDDLGGAASSIIEAEGERRKTRREDEETARKAEAEATDEVNILEREKKLLELRKAIEQLRRELQQPQP